MEKSKDKYKIILIILMVLAIFIRIIFICKTNISDYQFDVGTGTLVSEEDYDNLYKNFEEEPHVARHINYIMQLYTYNTLPNEIMGQFYHPPLHHFIMSSWLKLMDVFSNTSSFKLESMQFVILIYSIIILITLYKILNEFEFENKNKILPMLLFSFYPLYIFLSGSINNDELVIMFTVLVYLYLLKWEKNPTITNTLLLATFFGLGLMTKTSMIVMIIPSVYVYFKKLNEYVNNDKSLKTILLDLLIFAVVAGVLGLWFQVRSMINGLNTLGIIQPYENLRIATNNIWYRFGLTNILKMNSINVWNYLIYSSLNFGISMNNSIFIKIMAVFVFFIILDILYYLVKYFKENKLINITLIAWWISYFYLNISMPYICSMHSRYMVLPISLGIIVLGIGFAKEKNKFIKFQILFSALCISLMSIIYFFKIN
jgi:hypothetical protein